MIEEVNFISGATQIFAIVGDPIRQVRSPEMITAQFVNRGADATLIPIHAPRHAFEKVVGGLMAAPNFGGFVFTIPFKTQALALAGRLGPQAQIVGSINALARLPDGSWLGEIFDGIGCVTGIKKAGHDFAGRRVHLIGCGGAGSAIAVAVAFEHPAVMRLSDKITARAETIAAKVAQLYPAIKVEVGFPVPNQADILINATPVGMLDDPHNPLETDELPPSLVVFDAIVKPERTPLLRVAEASGCPTVGGREMMRGQVSRIADFLLSPEAGHEPLMPVH